MMMMTTTSRCCPPSIVVLLVVCCTSVVLAHAGSLLCDDSELCLSKRFLRFGRGLKSDPYYRLSRQFFRLNRSYQPYQDKRFLRFGRSQLQDLDDDMYDSAEPFSRKRRSLDTNDQLEVTHDHVRRSVDQSEMEKLGNDETPQLIKKRSTDDHMLLGLGDETSKSITKRSIDDKSFRNFEGEFDSESDDNNNNIIGGQFEKRFMRFGKRLIPAKRFMRFGRDHGMMTSNNADNILAKRFMRFGKRKVDDVSNDDVVLASDADMHKLSSVLSLANRLKSGAGGLDGGFYGTEKRFMRFGKRDVGAEGLNKES